LNRIPLWFAALTILVSVGMLAGCGGGGGNSTVATSTPVSLGIAWSARTRDVTAPSSALSAVVRIPAASSGGQDFTWTINRDAGTDSYTRQYTSTDSVATGTFVVTVKFHAQPNGKGDVVGIASQTKAIQPGLSLGTFFVSGSVASVELLPNQIVSLSQPTTLLFSAKDSSGHALAVTPGSAAFQLSSGTDVLSLTPDGVATGKSFGEARVQVTVDGVRSVQMPVLSAPTYTVRDVGNITGFEFSFAYGLNAKGQLVGSLGTDASGNGTGHPFVWDAGRMTDLDARVFGTTNGAATCISDDGTIAGFAAVPNSQGVRSQHAFILNGGQLADVTDNIRSNMAVAINAAGQVAVTGGSAGIWQNGTVTPLPIPSGLDAWAPTALNRAGDVTGYGYAQTIGQDGNLVVTNGAVLCRGGVAENLGTLGGSFASLNTINDAGDAGGTVTIDSNVGTGYPFLLHSGAITRLPLPAGETFGGIASVTNTGVVVGSTGRGVGASLTTRAARWFGTQPVDLNRLIPQASGMMLVSAVAANDKGQIACNALVAGKNHAVLLTPR
jgi:hypothetical protein